MLGAVATAEGDDAADGQGRMTRRLDPLERSQEVGPPPVGPRPVEVDRHADAGVPQLVLDPDGIGAVGR